MKYESKWQYNKYIHVHFNPSYSQESILKNTLDQAAGKIKNVTCNLQFAKNLKDVQN